MPKLNQILAVESSVKQRADRVFTDGYHLLQKAEPFSGLSRVYTPKDEEGERLPEESVLVQKTVGQVVGEVKRELVDLFDVVAQKDWANTVAKADIVVDDDTILVGVPVTYLLFLEKKLTDLQTVFVKHVPTLPADTQWNWDENIGQYKSNPISTNRTKKVPKNHVKYEATKEHPAQVEVFHEDVIVGTYALTKFSGAIPATEAANIKLRIEKLLKAVKFAREQANEVEAPKQDVGEAVLNYIFP